MLQSQFCIYTYMSACLVFPTIRYNKKLAYVDCSTLPPVCSHTQQTVCTHEDIREKENNDVTLACYSR